MYALIIKKSVKKIKPHSLQSLMYSITKYIKSIKNDIKSIKKVLQMELNSSILCIVTLNVTQTTI